MNRYFFYLFLLFLKTGIYAQQVGDIAIIPQPVSLEKKGGNFEFNSYSVIEVPDKTPEVQLVSRFLAQQLLKSTGFPVRIQLSGDAKDSKGTTIAISLNRKEDAAIGNEGYTLEVASSLVILRANKPAGLFYGAQTLLQLFPKEIESNELIKKPYWVLPGCKITDYPRFGWRGLMLDVSRHFFSKLDEAAHPAFGPRPTGVSRSITRIVIGLGPISILMRELGVIAVRSSNFLTLAYSSTVMPSMFSTAFSRGPCPRAPVPTLPRIRTPSRSAHFSISELETNGSDSCEQ